MTEVEPNNIKLVLLHLSHQFWCLQLQRGDAPCLQEKSTLLCAGSGHPKYTAPEPVPAGAATTGQLQVVCLGYAKSCSSEKKVHSYVWLQHVGCCLTEILESFIVWLPPCNHFTLGIPFRSYHLKVAIFPLAGLGPDCECCHLPGRGQRVVTATVKQGN